MADAALIAQLQAQVAALQAQVAAPAPAPAPRLTAYEAAMLDSQAAMLASNTRLQAGPAPTFAGNKGAGLEARKWLTGMQRWFDRAGVAADGERLIVVGTQLTGSAQVWWTGELGKALVDATRISTWAQFEAACSARFQPVDAGRVLRSQLSALSRKSGLSVAAYTEQFLEIVAQLADMGETDRVFWYTQGLNPAINALIAPLALATLRETTEAALRADAHRAAAQGNSSASTANSNSSSSSAGRNFGRFAARVTQMESAEAGSSPLDLVADMASTIIELEARLNAVGSSPPSGRGGRSHRGGRGSTGAPGGSGHEGSTARGPNRHPGATPGLAREMAQERMALQLCIRCGRSGHLKRECTHDAFVTSAKNPSSN